MEIWQWLILGFVYLVFTVAAVVTAGNGYRITTFAKKSPLLIRIEVILWPISIAITILVLASVATILFALAVSLTCVLLKDFIAERFFHKINPRYLSPH